MMVTNNDASNSNSDGSIHYHHYYCMHATNALCFAK
jgi:hypothetical protein